MLKRILEEEVMASQEEAIVYDDMDHRSVNEQFIDDLLATQNAAGEALDLGTGTARIPLLLCERTEDTRVIAVDLSESMLDLARLNIEIASMSSRVMLDRADAKELPFDDGRFDVVVSNSIIHHIPEPKKAFAESVRVCKKGGQLFFRDLVRPGSEEELAKLSETYTGEEGVQARKMFEDSLRAALTLEEVQAMVSEFGFPADTVSLTSDRHWTWNAVT